MKLNWRHVLVSLAGAATLLSTHAAAATPPATMSGSVKADGSTPPVGIYPNPDYNPNNPGIVDAFVPHATVYTGVGATPAPLPLGYPLPSYGASSSYSMQVPAGDTPRTITVGSAVPALRRIGNNPVPDYYVIEPYFRSRTQTTCPEGGFCSPEVKPTLYAKWGDVRGDVRLLESGARILNGHFAVSASPLDPVPAGAGYWFQPFVDATWVESADGPNASFEFSRTGISGDFICSPQQSLICGGVQVAHDNHWGLRVLGDGAPINGVTEDKTQYSNGPGQFMWRVRLSLRGTAHTQDVLVKSSQLETLPPFEISLAEWLDWKTHPEDWPENRPYDPDSPDNDCSKCPPQPVAPYPVSLITGNVMLDETDSVLPSAAGPAVFARSYNSFSGPAGSLGKGWQHSYDVKVEVLDKFILRVREADGAARYYTDAQEQGTFIPSGATHPTSHIERGADGFVRYFQNGRSEEFNADGRLGRLVDRLGRATTLSYSGDLLTDIVTHEGRRFRLEYSGSTLQRLMGPEGLVARYALSVVGTAFRLNRVTYADGTGQYYTYDNQGRLLGRFDLTGVQLDGHVYDDHGRATLSQRGGGQDQYRYVYDDGETRVIDGRGHTSVFKFAAKRTGIFVGELTGCGFCGGSIGTKKWAYNDDGRVTQHIDADGNETQYQYDGDGHVSAITNALLQTTTYGNYDEFGRPGTVTVPGYGSTTITYAPEGIQTSQDAGGLTTTYGYQDGRLSSVTTSGGTTYHFGYNAVGDMTSVTDARGNVWTYTYDPSGRRKTVTGPDDKTTTFEYDVRGRLTAVVRPDQARQSYHYDRSGRLDSMTDAAGSKTSYTYDRSGLVSAITDPMGGQTRFGYGAMSDLVSLTDAKGQITEFHYDSIGRMSSTVDPMYGEESYTYTSAGRLHTKTDRKGIVTTYDYDPLGRLKSETFSDGTPSVVLTYNDATRTRTIANGADTLTFITDASGRPISEASSRNQSTVSHTYNGDSQPETTRLDGALVAQFGYTQGDLHNLTASGNTFTFGYDNLGRRTSLTFPNGVVTAYDYDPVLGRLFHMGVTQAQQLVTDFVYTSDAIGNRLSKVAPGRAETYAYDALSRLTGLSHDGRESGYGYDGVGNRLSERIDGRARSYSYDARNRLQGASGGGVTRVGGTLTEAGTVSIEGQPARMGPARTFEGDVPLAPGVHDVAVVAADDSGNTRTKTYRVVVSGGATYSYDANGNLSQTPEGTAVTTYEWNALNQLTRVLSNGNEVASFKYDPFGRRVEKVAGGITTTYLYDGMDILKETRSHGTTFTYVHGSGIDEPLARIDGSGAVSYYHADALGSIVATTNAAGAVTSTRTYDAWGNIEAGDTASGFAFTGREWDAETQLYYYRARYYSAQTGHFISEDPIGFGGGLNFYSYAHNAPTNFSDPFGLKIRVAGTTAEVNRIEQLLRNLRRTKTGAETIKRLEDDQKRTVTIQPAPCDNYVNRFDPDTDTINLTLRKGSFYETEFGWVPAVPEQILAHEFGHADMYPSSEWGDEDLVLRNYENPVIREGWGGHPHTEWRNPSPFD
jgi:RHS repeat-associated protein